MFRAKRAFRAATGFLQENPGEVSRAVRNALAMRFSLPIPALRWLSAQAIENGAVEDLMITAAPPGLRIAATVDAMRTPVRASAVAFIERVDLSEEAMIVVLRIEDLHLKLAGDAKSPVAMLIKSGALNLEKPGDLVTHVPGLPPVVAEARGNRITLDFMRDARMRNNPMVHGALSVITSLVAPASVQTDSDHIDIAFRPLPRGVRAAASAVRRHVVLPSVARLLTSGR